MNTTHSGIIDDLMNLIISVLSEVKPNCLDEEKLPLRHTLALGADLGFQSLDVVRLSRAFQKRLDSNTLRFQELLINADGKIASDITIEGLYNFLITHQKRM